MGDMTEASPEPKRRRISQDLAEELGDIDDSDRPVGSCEMCKTRKVRCSRTRPSCDWCTKNGTECVYRIKRKPGLKPGFGKELNNRVGSLERKLEEHSSLIAHLYKELEGCRTGQSAPHSIGSSPFVRDSAHIRAPGNTVSPAVSTAPSNYTVSYDPPSPVGSASGHTDYNKQLLPDVHMTRELIEHFFVKLYPQFPIFHPIDTKAQLLSDVEASKQTGEWSLLLYAIVMVSLRFISNDRVSIVTKSRWYEKCKEKLILSSLNITTIASLQALTLLAFEMVGISNGPQTWNIMSLITSSTLYLGIGKDSIMAQTRGANNSIGTKSDVLLPFVTDAKELEIRRRLFWGVYALDRFSAVATSFSFRIDESEIDTKLPVRESVLLAGNGEIERHPTKTYPNIRPTDTPPETFDPSDIDPFGYLVEVLHILSNIHNFLRKPVNISSFSDVVDWQMQYRQHDQNIEDWHNQLPAEYSDPKSLFTTGAMRPNSMLILLHATYLTTIIRLHSSAGYSMLKSEFFTTSPIAIQRCLKATESISMLAKQVDSLNIGEFMGPHYAWCIWVSSRLLLVDCVTKRKPFPAELDILLKHLKGLAKRWKVASRYHEILSTVIDEELVLRTNRPGGPETDSKPSRSSQIISDMRRNAYALDYLLTSNTEKPENRISESRNSSPLAPNISLNDNVADCVSVSDMFNFFNWPKPVGTGEDELGIHSLDQYKHMLAKDANFSPDFNPVQDWLDQ
ncbi:hypothetical protein TRVA0_078S00232 [Trichomonascus vanleenenianus]|uniref:Zn(II)2Cys6 transcription factor n=1 Tax=Trichomonascus vanleenenianus TaxID=2268995 RepID=UPI003ECB989C